MAKNLVSGPILAINSGCQFFFTNLASSVTRYHGQISSCIISEKTNNPILRKLSRGRTDGRTDGRQWFQKTLSTDVEHPTYKIIAVLETRCIFSSTNFQFFFFNRFCAFFSCNFMHYEAWSYKKKKHKKDYRMQKICLERTYS